MLSKLKLTLFLAVLTLNTLAQKKALESITENELKAHLEFIASDYMQGRDFGTPIPGLEITADYLKAQCVKMGLIPGSDDYFQQFKMISIKADPENTFIELKNMSGNSVYINDSIFTYVGTDEDEILEGGLVFAGYGWTDSVKDYDDLDGLDVKDKFVIIMSRNYELAKDTAQKEILDGSLEIAKIENILKKGAKGILLVQDPMNSDRSTINWIRDNLSKGRFMLQGEKRPVMPGKIIFITRSIANNLLKSKGKTLRELQYLINQTEKPNTFEIKDYKANFTFGKVRNPISGNNVIGIVVGSDPVLKNECVVFTAHYDHVGINENGEVYNGADDNGSGTVALLEIAEAFTKLKKNPKRSIVFTWVTAEEKGLVG
ncbi:MAG: M28 family peptidase [Bacteroidetes bacterium]|nr:M28 family peptidase [Bacteroidota bacterium]